MQALPLLSFKTFYQAYLELLFFFTLYLPTDNLRAVSVTLPSPDISHKWAYILYGLFQMASFI